MSVPPCVRGLGSLVPSWVWDWLFVGKDTPDHEHTNDEAPQLPATRPDEPHRPSRRTVRVAGARLDPVADAGTGRSL